jgi:hypothetical protein
LPASGWVIVGAGERNWMAGPGQCPHRAATVTRRSRSRAS